MTNLSTEAVDLRPADSPVTPLPVVVLTAPGGSHPIKDDLRQILALTADGKLFISPQHLSDPFVMSFMDQLDHKEIEFEVVHASMSEIKALYQTSASTVLKKLAET